MQKICKTKSIPKATEYASEGYVLSELLSQKLIIQPIAYCNKKPQTKRERLRAVEVLPE